MLFLPAGSKQCHVAIDEQLPSSCSTPSSGHCWPSCACLCLPSALGWQRWGKDLWRKPSLSISPALVAALCFLLDHHYPVSLRFELCQPYQPQLGQTVLLQHLKWLITVRSLQFSISACLLWFPACVPEVSVAGERHREKHLCDHCRPSENALCPPSPVW